MKKIRIASISLLLLLSAFIYSNCSSNKSTNRNQQESPTPLVPIKINSGCFAKDSIQQIIANDAFFNGATWGDPTVLKINGNYVMYASSDNAFDQNIKIFRFISSNGLDWQLSPTNPVFEKSTDISRWDRKSVETPSVVFFKNKYYMFYTAYPTDQNTATDYRIFLATSIDGISWQRTNFELKPTDPNTSTPNLDFNQWIVAEPGAVVFQDKLFLYFAALGASTLVNSTLQTIGVITSNDGINWSTPLVALTPDQNFYPRNQNWKGYSTPAATVLNDEMNLFFNVVTDDPFKQLIIQRATSKNGLDSWIHDAQPILDLTQTDQQSKLGPWANVNIVSPTVLAFEDRITLWFSGHGDISKFPNVPMGIGQINCK